MKNFLFTAVCLFSLNSLAQSSAATYPWQKSAGPEVLKTSVTDAINWTTLKCSGTYTDEKGTVKQGDLSVEAVKYSIAHSSEVFSKADASQPVLFFKLEADEADKHYSTKIFVNTSADRKSVTTLDLKQRVTTTRMEQTGTIDQPKTEKVTVVVQDITGACQ